MAHGFVRWIVVLAAVPLTAACAANAISGSAMSSTDGLAGRTPAEVQRAAVFSVKAASSFHVTGKNAALGVELDLRMQGGSSAGTVILSGARVDITMVDGTTYAKSDLASLKLLGVPADVAPLAADKWMKTPGDMFVEFGVTISGVADRLAADGGGLRPGLEQTTLGGTPVVVITKGNGDKLYVASTGPARPLRFSSDTNGELNFSEYGVDFHITAPPDAIDGVEVP